MEKKIIVNNVEYEVVENYREALDIENLDEFVTDYYSDFDYIVGDWAYGKLRLKGFNDKKNKNFNKINDYQLIDGYLKNYCAFGCKYFILKKIKVEK